MSDMDDRDLWADEFDAFDEDEDQEGDQDE